VWQATGIPTGYIGVPVAGDEPSIATEGWPNTDKFMTIHITTVFAHGSFWMLRYRSAMETIAARLEPSLRGRVENCMSTPDATLKPRVALQDPAAEHRARKAEMEADAKQSREQITKLNQAVKSVAKLEPKLDIETQQPDHLRAFFGG